MSQRRRGSLHGRTVLCPVSPGQRSPRPHRGLSWLGQVSQVAVRAPGTHLLDKRQVPWYDG